MKRMFIGSALVLLGICAARSDLSAQEAHKGQMPREDKHPVGAPPHQKSKPSPSVADVVVLPSSTSGNRSLNIIGVNFKEGLTLTLIDPEGSSTKLASEQIISVKPTTISANAKLGKAGSWKVQVVNPDGAQSNSRDFTVPGKPLIRTVSAVAFSASSAQPLDIVGENFQNGLAVTLINPAGQVSSVSGDDIVSVKPAEVFAKATLGKAGRWKAIVMNSGGEASDAFEFGVGRDSEAIAAYSKVFWVITILLIFLVLLITVTLIIYMATGNWSLGDALSEEAAFQPKDITGRGNLIMVASSSRLIALLGLFGILTIVLGVGYSIIWNLFVNGSVPSLASVRSFLFGAATLFAPYLANQLREAFDSKQPEESEQETSGNETASVSVSGVIPHWPDAAPGNQQLTLTGDSFQPGLIVTLIDPRGVSYQLPPLPAADLHPTEVQVNAALATPGKWKATVTNPGAEASASFGFTVSGAPTMNPVQAVASAANSQDLTFRGSGFVEGLTVSMRRVQPAPPLPDVQAKVISVSPTELKVSAVLQDAGTWETTISNPGPRSTNVQFTVN